MVASGPARQPVGLRLPPRKSKSPAGPPAAQPLLTLDVGGRVHQCDDHPHTVNRGLEFGAGDVVVAAGVDVKPGMLLRIHPRAAGDDIVRCRLVVDELVGELVAAGVLLFVHGDPGRHAVGEEHVRPDPPAAEGRVGTSREASESDSSAIVEPSHQAVDNDDVGGVLGTDPGPRAL